MAGRGLIIRAVLAVVVIDLADFGRIAAGKLFGFPHDTAIDIGVLDPGTVDRDAAKSAASAAEMPMGAFAVAVTLPGVYFHVVAVATQGNF